MEEFAVFRFSDCRITRDHGDHPIRRNGASSTWAEAHPFSFSLQAVVLEFEIGLNLPRTIKTTTSATHDNFTCLSDQRKFGSFIFALHLIHLLSVLVLCFYRLSCSNSK